MYATLKGSKLYTPARNGQEFITPIDGPGVYTVPICRVRDGIVEFGGTGVVTVEQSHLAHTITPHYRLEITDVTFVI